MPTLKLNVKDIKQNGGKWGVTDLEWRKSHLGTDAGQDVIDVVYKKGSMSSEDQMQNGGMMLLFAPPGVLPSKRATTFGCKVFYPKNFDFVWCGKTGVGLDMGNGASSGGSRSANASSSRITWERNGSSTMYVYTPKNLHQEDKELDEAAKGGWGTEFFQDVFKAGTFKKGAWNDVSIKVVLNTFDSAGKPKPDGTSTMTINGKSATLKNVRWLSKPENIYQVTFHTFFGGQTSEFAAAKDETVLYKDFYVSN